MDEQPRAEYGPDGKRTTENEHVIPHAQMREMMRNPQTGESDFTEDDYRKAATVREDRATALVKTTVRHGPESDNARSAELKAEIAGCRSVDLTEDLLDRSLKNAYDAAEKTGSAVTEEQFNRGTVAEVGDIFDNQWLGGHRQEDPGLRGKR